jgi:type III pantothenate kinase
MNLIIDFGNTATKAATFRDDSLVEFISNTTLSELQERTTNFNFDHIFISTVSVSRERIAQGFDQEVIFLTHETPVPFNNTYETRETLGLDRIAAVAGSTLYSEGENCLIIDIGTCITYDFINSERDYLGGSISPGLQMRFRALHELTAGLPLVEFNPESPFIGKSTHGSISSGVLYGMEGEIQGMINRYTADFGNLKTILCGGGADFFENRLKGAIFAAPELVLRGLNRILLYNAS